MCEIESSVAHVHHAAEVFAEASDDFGALFLRIEDQRLFEAYLQARMPFRAQDVHESEPTAVACHLQLYTSLP